MRVQADKVLRHIVRAALEPEYKVYRADDDSNPGAITPQIITNILSADLIVADISGGNANVFYELAIAHGYDKPTVHIQSEAHHVPFDIRDMRVIAYDIQDLDSVEEAKKALKSSANFAAADPTRVETPLKGAESFKAVQTSNDPEAQVLTQVLDQITALRTEMVAGPPTARVEARNDDGKCSRQIVARAASAGRLKKEDFEGAITPRTTNTFNAWVRRILQSVTHIGDPLYLNATLFDEDMKHQNPDDWKVDEPPF